MASGKEDVLFEVTEANYILVGITFFLLEIMKSSQLLFAPSS